MGHIDGENLASLFRRIGRLPEDKAKAIARALCAGLAAVHDQGLLHRDLKPANVMLDGRAKVRLTDFRLAAAVEELSSAESLLRTLHEDRSPDRWDRLVTAQPTALHFFYRQSTQPLAASIVTTGFPIGSPQDLLVTDVNPPLRPGCRAFTWTPADGCCGSTRSLRASRTTRRPRRTWTGPQVRPGNGRLRPSA